MPDELIGFHGGPAGTKFEVTSSPWGPIRMVRVPDDEIVLPPDAPTWRVPGSHPTPEEDR